MKNEKEVIECKRADLLHILYSREQILDQVKVVADKIKSDLGEDEPIVFVCVLKGAFMFFADLIRHFHHVNVITSFITLSSYSAKTESSGTVKLVQDLQDSVIGKNVVIVEDIIDSGRTIAYLREYFADKKAKSVSIACLLNKPRGRVVDIECDYNAFTMKGDEFVVGYGLDYAQKFRNLSNIYYVNGEDDIKEVLA